MISLTQNVVVLAESTDGGDNQITMKAFTEPVHDEITDSNDVLIVNSSAAKKNGLVSAQADADANESQTQGES